MMRLFGTLRGIKHLEAERKLYEQALRRAEVDLEDTTILEQKAERQLARLRQEWKAVEFDTESPVKKNTLARLRAAVATVGAVRFVKRKATTKLAQRQRNMVDLQQRQEERKGWDFSETEEDSGEQDNETDWTMVDVRRDIFVDYKTVKDEDTANQSKPIPPKR